VLLNKSLIDSITTCLKNLGKDLLNNRKNKKIDGEWCGTQLKSSADILANKVIYQCLSTVTPEIIIISEESVISQVQYRPKVYWLIDPIDGTASYVNGFDGWVLQVALIKNETPVLGIIFAPATDELFVAVRGRGAWKNGKKLKPFSHTHTVRLIDNYPEPKGISKKVYKALMPCGYLESGSLSLKMLRILDGSADIFVKDVVVRDWDFAAPIVVSNELNGIFSQANGQVFKINGSWEKHGIIVCRNLELYRQVLSIVNK